MDTEIYPDLRYWVELSGDYDSYRSDWIGHGVQTTSDFAKADASSLEEFLTSSNDRLLLGDASVLTTSTLQIPGNIDTIYPPAWDDFQGFVPPQPVLLVKRS